MKAQITFLSKFILFFTLLLLQISHAENVPNKYFYYMGGGGEPKGPTTIFDDDLKKLSNFVGKSNWQTTISFNGGHAKTEEILANSFKGSRIAGDFIERNFETLIEEMIYKVDNGQIKAGDQLMVTINTHGAQNRGELTHKVALGRSTANELTNLDGASTVSLDRLEVLADLAAKKGVKLAVMDFSCFSGSTLKIKNGNTCVISASSADLYSYGGKIDFLFFSIANTFSGKFHGSMKSGKNLEELFLDARTTGSVPDFPMISTPEAEAIEEKLYRLISSYLKYNDNNSNHFHQIYKGDYRDFEEQVCNLDKNFNDVTQFLKQYEKVGYVSDQAMSNEFAKLREHLEKYRAYQLKYENTLRQKHLASIEVDRLLNQNYPSDKKLYSKYNAIDFLNINFDDSIKRMQDLESKTNDAYMKSLWKSSVNDLVRSKQIANEMKAKLPAHITKAFEDAKTAYANSGVTYDLASKVSVEAKKVYNELYKSSKTSNSNPCRDFVL